MTGSENNIVVGLQYGSEGKGRILDFLANRAGAVARFQGCSNGGRMVSAAGGRYRVCYLPCGIHHDAKKCLICCGVVLDLEKVSSEINVLKDAGVLKARLTISPSCHMILGCHKRLDMLRRRKFPNCCGPSCEPGLAQATADKYEYCGVTVGDLLSPAVMRQKIACSLEIKNELFAGVYGEKPLDADAEYAKYMSQAEPLLPYIGDPAAVAAESVRKNNGILFEGCGGAMNDVNRGFYPCVTPAVTISAAAAVGTGLSFSSAPRVIGVAKAYCTRTDEAPFVTKISGTVEAFLRTRGGEFGEASGSCRKIGWLDLPALRYAARENGAHLLALTKLDVLTGVDELKVCTAYTIGGKKISSIAGLTLAELAQAQPVYRAMPGWRDDLPACTDFLSLPRETQDYIKLVEDVTETSVVWVGVGGEWGNALFRINS